MRAVSKPCPVPQSQKQCNYGSLRFIIIMKQTESIYMHLNTSLKLENTKIIALYDTGFTLNVLS